MPNNNITHSAAESKRFAADTGKISHFLSLVHPDGNFEVMTISRGDKKTKTIITTREGFEADFEATGGAQNAAGCYVGLNPSSQNRGSRKRNSAETITSRRHLLVDIDGCKTGETPENRETLRKEAVKLAKRIAADLTAKGFPEPIIVNTGNGAQMWYRISAETGDDIVPRCLKALDAKYSSERVRVDTQVSDPARVGRLPGTWNRKPDYPENEWRMAEIVSEPIFGVFEEAQYTCLEELAKDIPSTGAGNSSAAKEVEGLEYDTEENRKAFRCFLDTRDGGVEGERGRGNLLETARFGGDFGLSPAAVVEELTTYERAGDGTTYNERCEPPWDISEMETVVESSYNGRHEPIGCKSPANEERKKREAIGLFDEYPDPPEAPAEAAGATTGVAGNGKPWLKFHPMSYYRANFPDEGVECYVEGIIPDRPALSILYADAGAGKTTIAYMLMECITAGLDFMGLRTRRETKRGVFRPAILNFEEDDGTVSFRSRKQAEALELDKCGDRVEPQSTNLFGRDVQIFKKATGGRLAYGDDFENIKRQVIEEGINFLIIDTLSRVFVGDENDRETVVRFGSLLDAFIGETKCAVLLVGHNNKSHNYSGTSAWEGIVRQRYSLKKEGSLVTLTVEKTNWMPGGATASGVFCDWIYKPVSAEEAGKIREEQKKRGTPEKTKEAYVEEMETFLKEYFQGQGSILRPDLLNFDNGNEKSGKVREAKEAAIEILIQKGAIIEAGEGNKPRGKRYPKYQRGNLDSTGTVEVEETAI